jgi:hypothetical protein
VASKKSSLTRDFLKNIQDYSKKVGLSDSQVHRFINNLLCDLISGKAKLENDMTGNQKVGDPVVMVDEGKVWITNHGNGAMLYYINNTGDFWRIGVYF